MTPPVDDSAQSAHRIPVIDRMMELLALLERRREGVGLKELLQQLGQPRTSVYRLLNSLQLHGLVRRGGDGTYRLGPRLLTLAAGVAAESHDLDLAAVAKPLLRRLSSETGQACKISVRDGGELLVLASVPGSREYALTVVPGQRIPLHVGAAGRVLLAHLDEAEREAILARPLTSFTARTFADPARLRRELARVRRQGWAQDKGEHAPSIHAFAAPILDPSGQVVAALSVPFLAGTDARGVEQIRRSVIATAAAISARLSIPAAVNAAA